MAGEDNDRRRLEQGFDTRAGLFLEGGVAGADAFVDEQDVVAQRGGNAEGEAGLHAGRIDLHGQFEEIAQIGEAGDFGDAVADLGPAHAEQRAA